MVQFCKSPKCLVGKTAIITGANAGIGYVTALELAKRGCRVILACRNKEKATEAREKIVKATGNENVVFQKISLDSMASVREFAKNIMETEERLDLLINNAGTAGLPETITEDGLQVEMATNYFSHFLLTNLLLDLLKKSAPSRIINVSAAAARVITNLNLEKLNERSSWTLYCKSKLCNILFTQELARRLEGSGVTTFSLHPGVVQTDFQNDMPFLKFLAANFFLNAEEGAQTSIYLAVEDGIEQYTGEHFIDCKKVSPYCGARDKKKAEELWKISENLVGLQH